MFHERRQAVRVPCELPIRIEGAQGPLEATLVDVSRTGLRLRIPGSILRVHRLSSLVQVTESLNRVLGEAFQADLNHVVLGSLIRRELKMTRIAKRDWERTDVEIGCLLDVPLDDAEVGTLGVALPPLDGDEDEPPSPAHELSRARPGRTGAARGSPPVSEPIEHRAFIYPAPGKTGRPLATRTSSVSPGTVVVAIERMQGWSYDDMNVAAVVTALDKAYGSNVLLRIVDGGEDLWAGPAEVKEVDVTPEPGIRIGLSFGRELRTEELDRLGLPTPA